MTWLGCYYATYSPQLRRLTRIAMELPPYLRYLTVYSTLDYRTTRVSTAIYPGSIFPCQPCIKICLMVIILVVPFLFLVLYYWWYTRRFCCIHFFLLFLLCACMARCTSAIVPAVYSLLPFFSFLLSLQFTFHRVSWFCSPAFLTSYIM